MNKSGLTGAVQNKVRTEYYKDVLENDKNKTFNSGNKALLKILIKAHKKVDKQKKLTIEEVHALLTEQESYWSTHTRSHEEYIKRLFIHNNIRDEKLYNELMELEKLRLEESIKTKKIVPVSSFKI